MKKLLLLFLLSPSISFASTFGTTDFLLEVSKGNVPKHSSSMRVGHANGMGTTRETIWYEGGTYVFPPSASIMTISSDNAADAAAGTGCRSVYIEGLDSSHLEISETVVPTGVAGVNTINSYLRVNRIICMSAGSSETNAGYIYMGTGVIAVGKPAAVYNLIPPGHGISHTAAYTVPANKTAYMARLIFTVSASKDAEIFFMTRASQVDPVWIESTSFDLNGATSPSPGFGFILQPKMDIRVEAQMSTGTGNIKVTGLLVLIEN